MLELTELGINGQTIRWPTISMQSHQFITILVNKELKIIDTLNKTIVSSKRCSASSAMMNPQSSDHKNGQFQLLALRERDEMKVVDVMNVGVMSTERAPKDEHILFWRWLDSEMIAFITTKCVYHWIPTLTQSRSKRILSLPDSACLVQYINYDQSGDGHYLFVQGLTQSKHKEHDEVEVDGVLTLYDINGHILQPRTNAFGACFASMESLRNITLFCFTKKEYIDTEDVRKGSITKLFIVELSRNHIDDEKRDGHRYHVRVERKVQFFHSNDFVVSMVQCESVLYAVTKLGCLLIFDISSGMCLYNHKVSRDVIFLVTPCTEANGIVALGLSSLQSPDAMVQPENVTLFLKNTQTQIERGS